jgi:hypothetical protein
MLKKKVYDISKKDKILTHDIKRSYFNIIDRINYLLLIKQYLSSIKETNNCMRLYNFDENTNKPIFRIGTKIILDKQIGTESRYGIVYLAHFKTNINYGSRFNKINRFAVKITNQSIYNKLEIDILNKLTKLAIKLICPHFPISYGLLVCNNSHIKSNNPDDYSIVKDKHNYKFLFPKLINKNKNLYIQINELASGDLHSNLLSQENKDILNTIVQVLLSIMFFHNYIGFYHCDTHTGNFLYHKIKPGGYFHYNIYEKDYYLENKGYLWIIWDFGLVQNFNNIPINYDFNYLLTRLNKYNELDNYHIFDNNTINTILMLSNTIINKYDKIYDSRLLMSINKEILNFLLKNVSSFTTTKPSNIINKIPYIIR